VICVTALYVSVISDRSLGKTFWFTEDVFRRAFKEGIVAIMMGMDEENQNLAEELTPLFYEKSMN
jgi:hypothetical protein